MSTFKKGKVVMLPTNQKANGMICKDITGQDKTIAIKTKYLMEHEDYIGHHLYIISDDEIKEGDWFLSDSRGTKQEPPKYRVEQCIKFENGWIFGHIEGMEVGHNPDWSKQIIATTDSSLWRPSHKYASDVILLPQPSQQFIEKYVEEYNKGNVITDVLVECELISNEEYFLNTINPDDDVPYFDENLKINPKDNTITIKIVKDSYTREEHISNIKKFSLELGSKIHCFLKEDGTLSISIQDVNKWIEENLSKIY